MDVFVIDNRDNVLLFDCKTNNVYEFDNSAKYIFDLLENPLDIDEIVNQATRHFQINKADAYENVVSFFKTLESKGLGSFWGYVKKKLVGLMTNENYSLQKKWER